MAYAGPGPDSERDGRAGRIGPPRWIVLGLLALALSLAPACSQGPGESGSPASMAADPGTSTAQYLPGLEADVHLPESGDGAVPVVLLVPGGGWETADRTGLDPLAEYLADAGFVAVNATYRAGAQGATYPVPAQDVVCASGFAVEAARAAGFDPGPVVVLGHSAGGHLASLAALAAVGPGEDCPQQAPTIDGLIGLAGVYDPAAMEYALYDFFAGSPTDQPEAWRQGDPVGLVDAGAAPEDLRVLLFHGDSDDTVPLDQSQTFAAALTRAGVPVRLDVVAAADHATVYRAEVAGPACVEWIEALAAERSPG